MAKLLKGAAVASALAERCVLETKALRANNIVPALAILRVGESQDQLAYERGVLKRCDAVGIATHQVVLPCNTDQATMMHAVNRLNNNENIHGILMLRPLPKHLDEAACCEALLPTKDVDAATNASLTSVFTGSGAGFASCTAQACMEILDYYGIDLEGKRVVVIGRSLVVGRPVAMLLMHANATVTICHAKTRDLFTITREADVVVVAVGRMEAFGAEYFRAGQTVLDVGIGWNDQKGKLCGDVKFDEVESVVDAITPVPGGVGSVTTAVLALHVLETAKRYNNKACI